MPEIQSSDPGRKLRERYDLVGASPAPFLAPELVPVVIVDDLTEFDVLSAEFERPCTVHETQGAPGAGVHAVVMLANPSGSGVLAIGDDVYLSTAPGGRINWRLFASAPVIADHGQFRDSRLPGTPACGSVATTSGVAPDDDWQIQLADLSIDTAGVIYPLPYVISPGFVLQMKISITNISLSASIRWRERTL